MKTLIVAVLLAGVVPLLLGLLFELVIVAPLRVPLDQTPLFYPWQVCMSYLSDCCYWFGIRKKIIFDYFSLLYAVGRLFFCSRNPCKVVEVMPFALAFKM